MKKLPKDSVGRFARIRFDDVGVLDGIIVSLDNGETWFRWLGLFSRDTESVDVSQVVAIGDYVSARDTGLPV